MRPSVARLMATAAASSGAASSPLKKPVPLALLPPVQLYRRLLRAHRKFLPHEMRVLGDEYVKAEFRAHKDVDNPIHIIGFLTEWQLYAQKVEGESWAGEKLDKAKLEKMSEQQIGQLYELMQAIRNGDPEVEEEGSSS